MNLGKIVVGGRAGPGRDGTGRHRWTGMESSTRGPRGPKNAVDKKRTAVRYNMISIFKI